MELSPPRRLWRKSILCSSIAALVLSGVGSVGLSSARAAQFWDGNGTAGNGIINGGTGTWDGSTTNWTTFDGSTNSVWAGGDAVFGISPGGTGAYSVTLSGTLSATSLSFGAGGYSLSGAALTLTGAPTLINVAQGAASIGSPLAGTAATSKTGAGQLILTADDSGLTGGLTLSAGSIQATVANALGGVGNALVLNGGTGLQNYVALSNATGLTYGNNATLSGSVLIISDRGGVGSGAGAGAGVTNTFGTLSLNGNLLSMNNSQTSSGTSGLTFGAVTLGDNSSIQSLSLFRQSGHARFRHRKQLQPHGGG